MMTLMVALWNRADHYIFMLWFVVVVLLLLLLFSSPNLSRRRLDVCHTSTHGDGAQMAIFGDFFASCVFSEPRAAGFRPAS